MNKVIIITGPSGVGKGTIEKELFKFKELKLALSCSMTTRKKRANEVEGVHYYFSNNEEFSRKIENDEFLEYSSHFGNYYGTLKSEVDQHILKGFDVIVEVDTVGAINIINKFNDENKSDKLISIFITPPNLEVLEERIRTRNSESDDSIKQRLKKAKKEIKQTSNFKFIIINNNLADSVNKIIKAIKGESYELQDKY
ncbi:MAG: guanylate kinase [Mycoplasmataceae bacterium]|nr:guanylate kinase [Mycoplasmataceae bacterium]